MVEVGPTAPQVGNELPSTTNTFLISWIRCQGSTTDRRGSRPIRAVPMKWLVPVHGPKGLTSIAPAASRTCRAMTCAPADTQGAAHWPAAGVYQKCVAAHEASLRFGLVELLTEQRIVNRSVTLHRRLEDPEGSRPDVEHEVLAQHPLLVPKSVRKELRLRVKQE